MAYNLTEQPNFTLYARLLLYRYMIDEMFMKRIDRLDGSHQHSIGFTHKPDLF